MTWTLLLAVLCVIGALGRKEWASSALGRIEKELARVGAERERVASTLKESKADLVRMEKQIAHGTIEMGEAKVQELEHKIEKLRKSLRVLHDVLADSDTKLEQLVQSRKRIVYLGKERKQKQQQLTHMSKALKRNIEEQKQVLRKKTKQYKKLKRALFHEASHFDEVLPSLRQGWKRSLEEGGSYSPLGYRMDYDGVIHLQGVATGGLVKYAEGRLFDVSHLHAPTHWPVSLALSENDAGRIDVMSDGKVTAVAPEGNTWFSLDGVQFPSGQVDISPLPFAKAASEWKPSPLHGPPSFFVGRTGTVFLDGVAQARHVPLPNTRHHGTLIGILPEEARPSQWTILAALANNHLARVDVETDGSVLLVLPRASSWVSLSSLSFPSSSSSVQPLALHQGWKVYNEKHPSPGIAVSDDRVLLSGVVQRTDDNATHAVIARLPVSYRPPHRLVFATIGDNTVFRVDVLPSGDVLVVAPRPEKDSWVALDGISFFHRE